MNRCESNKPHMKRGLAATRDCCEGLEPSDGATSGQPGSAWPELRSA